MDKKNIFIRESLFKRINPYYGGFLFFQIISYFLVGFVMSKFSLSLWSPKTFVDSYIPFLPFMIIPYMLYPVVMAVPLFVNLRKMEMKSLLISLLFASLITYLFAFSYSVSPSPRHLFFGEERGVLIFILKTLYKYDTSPIYFPSLHALHSLLIGIHLWKNGNEGKVLLPCALLISISTVFVKQHFIVDTLASLLIAPIIYYFNRRVLFFETAKEKQRESN